MKNVLKRLLLCALVLAALVSASAAAIDGAGRAQEPERRTVTAALSAAYTLRDWHGRIAVFTRDAAAPEEITNIATDTLNYVDREKLREGIEVQSCEELLRLLEDLSS